MPPLGALTQAWTTTSRRARATAVSRRRQWVALAVLVIPALLAGCTSSPSQQATPPSGGISVAEAVEIAVAAVPERFRMGETQGQAMQYEELTVVTLDPEPEADVWLWLVTITGRDRGAWVVVDYHDGTVLKVVPWIA